MRIIIADDQANVRSALALLLEQEAELTVVAEAADAVGLLQAIHRCQPDLLLLDWELPGLAAEHLLNLLHYDQPDLVVIALSGRPEAAAAAQAAGADAFISKSALPEQVLTAVLTAAADQRPPTNDE
jgi:DNA-binding NarL/FixJ family response regulator